MSIRRAAFAVVCQESESPRTAPSIMNNPSPPLLMLVKEALNKYERGAPTLNARGKEALSYDIIRKGDVCIAPLLSTVCQVRAATSTISTLATSIMKANHNGLLLSAWNQRSPWPHLPSLKAPPSLKLLPSLKAVRKRMPSLIIKCSAHSMRLLKTSSQRILPPTVGAQKGDGF